MMKQGIQNTFKDAVIKEYGCYLLCLCRYAEVKTGIELTTDDVYRVFNEAVKLTAIRQSDCYMQNPVTVLNLAARKPIVKNVTMTSIKPTEGMYVICSTKPGYTHFTLWDGNAVWDPLDPKRPTAKSYKEFSYRRFT